MAETLKSWPGRYRPRNNPYPWAKWLNGQIVKLRQGNDYQTSSENFRNLVGMAAKRLGKRVITTVVDNGTAVVVQALEGK